MTLRAVWLHLRVPFSFFLLPVFWFALYESPAPVGWRVWLVGFILHGLLYPASNAYNSYYDKDEGSIGILETPPPVDKTLFWVAIGIDGVALLLGLFLGWPFVIYLLIYGLISKAYSNDRIRLKRYPVLSWLVVGAFQGGFTYLMTWQTLCEVPMAALWHPKPLLAALLCTLNVLAVYPITQVYQHEEDARRGDLTLSRLLGVRGTFACTLLVYTLSLSGFWLFFDGQRPFFGLLLFLLPAMLYFVVWYSRVHRDSGYANFRSAMLMTLLAGVGLNGFFVALLLLSW